MTPDLIDLSRRVVACPRFRWMPGMAGTDALGVPFRCALTHHSGGMMVVAGMAFMPAYPDALARMSPDLTDPATLGCLFALVTEAYYDPKRLWDGYVEIHRDQHAVFYLEQAVHDEDGYLVWNCVCSGETKAEVLVHALEIAT